MKYVYVIKKFQYLGSNKEKNI